MSFQATALRAEITMPDLQELQLSEGTNGTAMDFVLAHDFRVELSGGSALRTDGEAGDLDADCSGGSRLELSDLAVNDADIVFSGGSQGTINLEGRWTPT